MIGFSEISRPPKGEGNFSRQHFKANSFYSNVRCGTWMSFKSTAGLYFCALPPGGARRPATVPETWRGSGSGSAPRNYRPNWSSHTGSAGLTGP